MLSQATRTKIENAVRARIAAGLGFCRGEFVSDDGTLTCALGALGFKDMGEAALELEANVKDLENFAEGFDHQIWQGQNTDKGFGADMARLVYESGVQFEDLRNGGNGASED